MKKISQVIIILMIILIQIITIPSTSYAAHDFWKEIFEAGDKFIATGIAQGGDSVIDGDDVKKEFSKIYNAIFIFGIVTIIIIGAILGVKFIFGSIEEQVKVKEILIPYIIGCVVILGAFGIWKIAIEIGNSILSNKDAEYEAMQTCYDCGGFLTEEAGKPGYCHSCGTYK